MLAPLPKWTKEQLRLRGTPNSAKVQYWSISIRWFCVIYRTLVCVGCLPRRIVWAVGHLWNKSTWFFKKVSFTYHRIPSKILLIYIYIYTSFAWGVYPPPYSVGCWTFVKQVNLIFQKGFFHIPSNSFQDPTYIYIYLYISFAWGVYPPPV